MDFVIYNIHPSAVDIRLSFVVSVLISLTESGPALLICMLNLKVNFFVRRQEKVFPYHGTF